MKPLATLRRIPAALALAVAAGACATSPAREGEDAPGVEIEVVNNTVPSYDRTVYLLDLGGSRRMLGRVLADSTTTLRFVGPTGADQFRLQARPVGNGTTVTSPPFTMGVNRVRWNVQPNIVVSGR
ncbi:MAG TPA: hypothetical protein VF584_18865 [Longimicrobium sp.]